MVVDIQRLVSLQIKAGIRQRLTKWVTEAGVAFWSIGKRGKMVAVIEDRERTWNIAF
jgi:hypothetical protein